MKRERGRRRGSEKEEVRKKGVKKEREWECCGVSSVLGSFWAWGVVFWELGGVVFVLLFLGSK